MSLKNWCENGWLRPYRTSPSQIALTAILGEHAEDQLPDRGAVLVRGFVDAQVY
jgi:hypothetical protein